MLVKSITCLISLHYEVIIDDLFHYLIKIHLFFLYIYHADEQGRRMKIKLLSIALAATVALVGCNKSPDNSPDTKPAATASVTPQATTTTSSNEASTSPATALTYTVGTISSFPPFITSDEKGQATGFDVDILPAIADRQGFKLQFLISPWTGLLDKLNTGERDIVTTGVIITPERQQKYDFSNPYLDSKMSLILSKNAAAPYLTFDEAMRGIKTVAVQKGSAGLEALKQKTGANANLQVQEVNSEFLGIQSVV